MVYIYEGTGINSMTFILRVPRELDAYLEEMKAYLPLLIGRDRESMRFRVICPDTYLVDDARPILLLETFVKWKDFFYQSRDKRSDYPSLQDKGVYWIPRETWWNLPLPILECLKDRWMHLLVPDLGYFQTELAKRRPAQIPDTAPPRFEREPLL